MISPGFHSAAFLVHLSGLWVAMRRACHRMWRTTKNLSHQAWATWAVSTRCVPRVSCDLQRMHRPLGHRGTFWIVNMQPVLTSGSTPVPKSSGTTTATKSNREQKMWPANLCNTTTTTRGDRVLGVLTLSKVSGGPGPDQSGVLHTAANQKLAKHCDHTEGHAVSGCLGSFV